MLGRARLSGPAAPLLGAAVGLLLGGAVTLVQDSTYRADASIVLVRQGQPPGSDPKLAQAADAAAELFETRAVAESAVRNLGLEGSSRELLDRIEVDAQQGSSLLRIDVAAPSGEDARRTAQEVTEVAIVLFNDRFAPETVASVWEPASARDERVSPKPARNLALGLLLGALAGLALVLAGLRRPVTRRPRAPAPKPASAPPATATRGSAAPPPPLAPPKPATGPFVLPRSGEWTLADVERLVAEHGHAFPELHDELGIYLDSFRSVAGADGRLPGDVDLVIEDVFAPLIERAR